MCHCGRGNVVKFGEQDRTEPQIHQAKCSSAPFYVRSLFRDVQAEEVHVDRILVSVSDYLRKYETAALKEAEASPTAARAHRASVPM